MTTFTSEDRIAAQQMPTVIVDSGASFEPIPFAGMVNLSDSDFDANLSQYAIKIDYTSSDPKSS
jgi:hypothetical protein